MVEPPRMTRVLVLLVLNWCTAKDSSYVAPPTMNTTTCCGLEDGGRMSGVLEHGRVSGALEDRRRMNDERSVRGREIM